MQTTLERNKLANHSPRFATRMARRIGEGTKNVLARLDQERDEMKRDEAASMNVDGMVGIVIGIAVVAALIPTIVDSIDDGNESLFANYPAAAAILKIVPLVLVAGTLMWVWKKASASGGGR